MLYRKRYSGCMNTSSIPSPEEIAPRLEGFGAKRLTALSEASGVPFTTLLKLRRGETTNPRILTVRAIWPHLTGPARMKAKSKSA